LVPTLAKGHITPWRSIRLERLLDSTLPSAEVKHRTITTNLKEHGRVLLVEPARDDRRSASGFDEDLAGQIT
jgi:hypothetical protein